MLNEHQKEIRDSLREVAEEFGVPVRFQRGSITIRVQHAVRARELELTDNPMTGAKVGEVVQEWLIEAKLLKHDGAILTPQRKDTINTDTECFRVMPAGKEGPLWRWVDRSGQTFMRIFTKER